MGESLYAILGVDEDADQDAIKDAFRDHAKTHHPDVSDAPDATRRFKRLTLARDTLLDEKERERYDELGHTQYIRQHDRADLFDLSTETTTQSDPEDPVSAAKTVTDGYGSSEQWWRDRAGPEPKAAAAGTSAQNQSRYGRSSASWVRSSPSTGGTDDQSLASTLIRFVGDAGIWLVLHFLLFFSAVATAIFLYTSVGVGLAFPAVVFGLLIVLVAVAASTFHLVSIVYT